MPSVVFTGYHPVKNYKAPEITSRLVTYLRLSTKFTLSSKKGRFSREAQTILLLSESGPRVGIL